MSAQIENNIAAFLKCIIRSQMHLHFWILIFGLSFHAILFISLEIGQCDFLFLLSLQSDAQRDEVKSIKQMAESNQCSQMKGHTVRKDESETQKTKQNKKPLIALAQKSSNCHQSTSNTLKSEPWLYLALCGKLWYFHRATDYDFVAI